VASVVPILTLAGCVTPGPWLKQREANVQNPFQSLPTQAPLAERREARPSDASKEA
jgi:starvation-inducible outer membrane lipoprotein